MKKLICYTSLLFVFFLVGCQEKGVRLFGTEKYIYFDKYFMDAIPPGKVKKDSTNATFFFSPPTEQTILTPLIVKVAGRTLTQDLDFALKVVPEMTTAKPDMYTLDTKYTFHSGKVLPTSTDVRDTIFVKINRTPELMQSKGVRLTLELVPLSDDVRLGQYEQRRAVIFVTPTAVKPIWWDQVVELSLLGTYSPKKYLLFLEHIDKNREMNQRLVDNEPSRALSFARAFKKWLGEQSPRILEEDGEEMTVSV